MIPKIIHYCWFGNNKQPDDVKERILEWKKIMPDFQFVEWNEENFDVESTPYTSQAHAMKKYAYVTDYVRLFALREFGGIYMDTDVDVLKSLDYFLKDGAFTGCESSQVCVTGVMGSEKNHPWIVDLIEYYDSRDFMVGKKMDLTPNTNFITEITKAKYGWIQENSMQLLKNGLVIYPFDYLCAKNWEDGKISITKNTYAIHNFNGSWLSSSQKRKIKVKGKIKKILKIILGEKMYNRFINKHRGMSNGE